VGSVLTVEELAILTSFDCLAHDVMRKKAADGGKVAPCWLCCSDDARADARNEALWLLRGATGRVSMSMDEAAQMAERAVASSLLERWREAEASHKTEREAGNPRAFFA
jgi:hypothetical protein